MKKVLLTLTFLLILLGWSVPSRAQVVWVTGNITATNASCTSTACVFVNLPANAGAVSFVVSGTFSATLQFEVSVDGTNFVAVNAFPPSSTTAVTSTTGTGSWTAAVAGMTTFRVRASAYTSGTAVVAISVSNAISAPSINGGGGSGSVSGQANGVIPLATAATTIGAQSHIDDGVTTLGTITSTEAIVAPSFTTTGSKCSADGTSANPSVVSCGSSAAGAFSCATAASTGTCTVNTTASLTASVILIQPDTSAKASCNATADTGLTAQRIASRVNATSFTINLGTFSTTKICFTYVIF